MSDESGSAPDPPAPASIKLWLSALSVIAGIGGAVAALSQVSQFVRDGQWLDLAVGFLGVVLIAAIAGTAVLRARRRHGHGASQGTVLGVAVTFSVLLVLGSVAVAAVLVDPSASGRAATPSASEPATVQAPPTPVVPVVPPSGEPPPGGGSSGGATWTEAFDGDLDPARWEQPDRPDVIQVASGRLEFRVTPQVTPEDFLAAQVRPRPIAGPIAAVSFMGTAGQGSGSDGGVDLIVRQASGRESRLRLGPSPAGPGVEPWVCLELPCGVRWTDFDHPTPAPLSEGIPARVEMVHTGDRVELRAAGIVNAAPLDATGIVEVGFSLEAGRGEQWTVTVDDLRITPA